MSYHNVLLPLFLLALATSRPYKDDECQDLTCDSESPPVCGFFEVGCPFGTCSQDYGNICAACEDPSVLFTEPGFCETITGNCDLVDIPEVCPESYSPVCASLRGCTGQGCTQTFDNACFACSAGGYQFFKNGICENDRESCGSSPSECNADSEPVCAFFDEPCSDGLCFATADSSCQACTDEAVDYFISGVCGTTFDNRVYCLPNHRPLGCPDNVDPVCAYKPSLVCITEPCPNHETIFNGCTACQDPAVESYTPGECPGEGV